MRWTKRRNFFSNSKALFQVFVGFSDLGAYQQVISSSCKQGPALARPALQRLQSGLKFPLESGQKQVMDGGKFRPFSVFEGRVL